MRYLLVGVLAGLVVGALAGCGSDATANGAGYVADLIARDAATGWVAAGASQDAGQNAWVLGGEALAVTRDMGRHWTRLSLPCQAASVRGVAELTGQTVAVCDAHTTEGVEINRLRAGAKHWRQQTIPLGVTPGAAEVVDAHGRLTGIAVTEQTSSDFSEGKWLAAGSRGHAWSVHAMPVGGSVTDVGSVLWLIGGVTRSQVYRSANDGASWAPVQMPLRRGSTRPAAFSPLQVSAGTLVLAATSSHETEILTGSAEDRPVRWREIATLRLGGTYGTGAAAEVSTEAGVLWDLGPAGRLARVTLGNGDVSIVNARGLPKNGATALYATSAHTAWAFSSTEGAHGIYMTANGGKTWSPHMSPRPLVDGPYLARADRIGSLATAPVQAGGLRRRRPGIGLLRRAGPAHRARDA